MPRLIRPERLNDLVAANRIHVHEIDVHTGLRAGQNPHDRVVRGTGYHTEADVCHQRKSVECPHDATDAAGFDVAPGDSLASEQFADREVVGRELQVIDARKDDSREEDDSRLWPRDRKLGPPRTTLGWRLAVPVWPALGDRAPPSGAPSVAELCLCRLAEHGAFPPMLPPFAREINVSGSTSSAFLT